MTWQTEALSRYGSVALGLVAGTAARYGIALNEGKRLSWGGIIGDVLLLLLIGLLSTVISDKLGLTGSIQAFVTALLALSSDRIIKLIRKQFESIAEQRVNQFARAVVAGDLAKLPAGKGLPDNIRIEVINDETAYGSALRSRYRKMTQQRPPDDQIELLKRLDEIE